MLKNKLVLVAVLFFGIIANMFVVAQTCPWDQTTTNFNTLATSAGANIVIAAGTKVLISTTPTNQPNSITVNGELIFANSNINLSFAWMRVNTGGKLTIGSNACPITSKIVITITGTRPGTATNLLGQDPVGLDNLGDKGIAIVYGASIQLVGAFTGSTWTRLRSTANAGSNTLDLEKTVNWKVGDRIVIATTDFHPMTRWTNNYPASINWQLGSRDMPEQNEERVITAISGSTITLDRPLNFTHVAIENERAEVGVLTRNIVIQGDDQSLVDGFGGHLMIRNAVQAQISGVEFTKFGQRGVLGRYPVHFHLMFNKIGQNVYLKDCSIWKCFQRFATIHNSNGILVQNNVGYDTFGHGYFLEDGGERVNTFDSNLGIKCNAVSKEGGQQIIPTDNEPTVFWITNPNNTFTNNAAVQGKFGFWHVMPVQPTGHSTAMYPTTDAEVRPRWTPNGIFENNVAHSNAQTGFMIDEMTKMDGTTELAAYTPLLPPYAPNIQTWQLTAIQADFVNLVAYKNRRHGIWARGGPLRFSYCWLADNGVGYNAPPGPTFLEHSIVIAETANVGKSESRGRSVPSQWNYADPIKGIETYDNGGPQYANNITFRGFDTVPERPAGCLGFLDAPFLHHTRNKYKNMRIAGNAVYAMTTTDSQKGIAVLDQDGSITGTPNTWISGNSSLLLFPGCTPRPSWNMHTCPAFAEGYMQFRMQVAKTSIDATQTTFLDNTKQIVRASFIEFGGAKQFDVFGGFEDTSLHMTINGITRRGYTVRFANGMATPSDLTLYMQSTANRDWMLFAIPYPPAAQPFTITYTKWDGNSAKAVTSVNSLSALTETTFFYDTASEHLFLLFRNTAGASAFTERWNFNDYNLDGGTIYVKSSCNTCKPTKTAIPSASLTSLVVPEDYYKATFDASRNRVAFFFLETASRLLTMNLHHDFDTNVASVTIEQATGISTKRNVELPTYSRLTPIRTSITLSYGEYVALITGQLSAVITLKDGTVHRAKILCNACSVGKVCKGPSQIPVLDPSTICALPASQAYRIPEPADAFTGWPGWDIWTWTSSIDTRATVANRTNTAQVFCGATSIYVSIQAGSFTIAHHTSTQKPNPTVDLNTYSNFEFYARTLPGYSNLELYLTFRSATAQIAIIRVDSKYINTYKIDETQWSRVRIPVADLGLSGVQNVQQISFSQNEGWNKPRIEFYLDHVQFVTSSTDSLTAVYDDKNTQTHPDCQGIVIPTTSSKPQTSSKPVGPNGNNAASFAISFALLLLVAFVYLC